MSKTINTDRVNNSQADYVFNAKYAMNHHNVGQLGEACTVTTILDDLTYLFTKPSDYLISLRLYPFDIKDLWYSTPPEGDGSRVPVGNTFFPDDENISVHGFSIDFTNMSNVLDMGSITIPTLYNSFLDYAPYTKIECFLPYIGIVPLPVNEVMGKTINFKYAVDFDTGIASANIIVDDTIILTADGKIGFEFPLGSSNSIEVSRNMLMTGIHAGGAVATIGLSMAAGSAIGEGYQDLANSLKSQAMSMRGGNITAMADLHGITQGISLVDTTTAQAIQGSQQTAQRFGTSDTKTYFRQPQNIYLIITRPNAQYPSMYNHYAGRPSLVSKRLDNVYGFTQLGDIHLEGFSNSLPEEVDGIDRLLRSGVMFPNLIEFTIDGNRYYAPEDMTWTQWVTSSFNTGNFYVTSISGDNNVYSSSSTYIVDENLNPVNKNDTIIDGDYYLNT